MLFQKCLAFLHVILSICANLLSVGWIMKLCNGSGLSYRFIKKDLSIGLDNGNHVDCVALMSRVDK